MRSIEVEENIKVPKINGASDRVADLCAEIQTGCAEIQIEIQRIKQELTQLPSIIANAISETYRARANS